MGKRSKGLMITEVNIFNVREDGTDFMVNKLICRSLRENYNYVTYEYLFWYTDSF